MDPYGLRRVVSPPGVLPQRRRPRSALPLGEDELSIAVEALNVDAASFRPFEVAFGRDPERIGAEVLRIVGAQGKLQNPVTGSGGMLIGRVRAVGPRHPAAATEPGRPDRDARVAHAHAAAHRSDPRGATRRSSGSSATERRSCSRAGSGPASPKDLPETLALAALDVCGAPALVGRHVRPGARVLVLGAGKSGLLVAAHARALLAGAGEVVAADRSEAALAAIEARPRAIERSRSTRRTVATLAAVEAAGGPFDLVVNCASVAGTELASVLAVKDGGAVIFFSMATSFTAAALGAGRQGRDAAHRDGYVPGHAELTLDLLRRNAPLRALFEERYAR